MNKLVVGAATTLSGVMVYPPNVGPCPERITYNGWEYIRWDVAFKDNNRKEKKRGKRN